MFATLKKKALKGTTFSYRKEREMLEAVRARQAGKVEHLERKSDLLRLEHLTIHTEYPEISNNWE